MKRVAFVLCALLGLGLLRLLWWQYGPLPAGAPGDAARGEWAFLHSDLGSKWYGSMPRAVYEAMPKLVPDVLVEGWEGSAGLLPDPQDPQGPPVGMVRARMLGSEWYAPNCAMCHAGRSAALGDRIIPGAPNADLDVQRLVFAIDQAIRRGKGVADVERATHPLSITERLAAFLYLRIAGAKLAARPADWFKDETGPGRSDALNGWKRALGLDANLHRTIVDLPPIFNQRLKTRTLYDGSITGDGAARVMLTELQKGRPARGPLMERAVFDDLVAWMRGPLAPPRYPLPIDAGRARAGHQVFARSCSGCHGDYTPDTPRYPDKRVSLEQVGTDPERALAMGPELATALERYDFRKLLTITPEPAYMPPPLDGVYLTAPYLHNGSVPTLWHLLHPVARPLAFYRRFNGFDPEKVGLVCEERPIPGGVECAPDAAQRAHDPRVLYRLDTRLTGNGNGGHLYGADLPESDKLALLEYLKTI